jgi:hypothetical protein
VSEAVFAAVAARLTALVQAGDLVRLREASGRTWSHVDGFLTERYRCRGCGAVWRLVHPDQAYRGDLDEVTAAGGGR